MKFFVNLKMGEKSSLTDVQRTKIVTLDGEDYTKRKIFEKLNCSKTTVHNAIAKHRTDGFFMNENAPDDPIKLQSEMTVRCNV